MRPTSAELITRIAEALDQQVLPAIRDDKWAASVVRSATTLLNHLAVRVEREAPVLLADNEDVRAVLAKMTETYPDLTISVLDAPPPTASYDVVALEAQNRQYQVAVEQLLRRVSGEADATSAGIRKTLRSYLKRRMERERDLYFPAFIGPPF